MFLPESAVSRNELAQLKAEEAALAKAVETKVRSRLPQSVNDSIIQMAVQEVQCGDPNCAPVDTVICVMFEGGGQETVGVPCTMAEVDEEFLNVFCPPANVWMDWAKGIENNWHPAELGGGGFMDEEEYLRQYMDQVKLRFSVGAIVECRVGTDPVTGWAGGRVLSLYYREANWPPTSIAPYKVKLDDGRSIFAPADDDQVIRLKKIST